MKTRVVLFTRQPSGESPASGQILFARWSQSLVLELPAQIGVEDFARQMNFRRHSTFDYTVGEMGKTATLLECPSPAPNWLTVDDARTLQLVWDNFRGTAMALSDGQDRRFLQLAVQFLAAGAKLDDSVIASDYDADFIKKLQNTLAEQQKQSDSSSD